MQIQINPIFASRKVILRETNRSVTAFGEYIPRLESRPQQSTSRSRLLLVFAPYSGFTERGLSYPPIWTGKPEISKTFSSSCNSSSPGGLVDNG